MVMLTPESMNGTPADRDGFVNDILTRRFALSELVDTNENKVDGVCCYEVCEEARVFHPNRMGMNSIPEGGVLGTVVIYLEQRTRANLFDFLGGGHSGSSHQGMPVDAVGVKEMDFRNWRLGNEVQQKGACPTEAYDRDLIAADMVLHRCYPRPRFEGIGYVERVG